MSLVSDIRKTVTYTTPVYAVVGATDLAVEKVRGARVLADFQISAFQGKAVQRAEQVAEQAQQLPTLALNQTLEVAGKAQATYAELAVRGEKLVKRVRNQKSTKDLFAQAGSTVSYGKSAVTTVKKAAVDTTRTAKKAAVDTTRTAKTTLSTGRHEAGAAVASVLGEVSTTTRNVRNSRPAVRLASKRPATVAKKSTAPAKKATKAAAPAAAPVVAPVVAPVATTATTATPAAKIATPKVSD